jgi:hypothetical protein
MNDEIQPTTLVPIPGDVVAAYRALAAHRHGGRVMPAAVGRTMVEEITATLRGDLVRVSAELEQALAPSLSGRGDQPSPRWQSPLRRVNGTGMVRGGGVPVEASGLRVPAPLAFQCTSALAAPDDWWVLSYPRRAEPGYVARSCRSSGSHSPPGSVFLDGRQARSCQDACTSSLLDDLSGLTRGLGGALRARVELERQGSLRPALDRDAPPKALAADLRIRLGEVVAANVSPDARPADAEHFGDLGHSHEVQGAHVDETTYRG